ncbi:uncharacterized protein LOC111896084 [Lactuca sativa]|uniref:uncharacterized protein LOC111896084 n=1 Tax=Lactuca sativa TaxID=4236 RepID=UPI000CD9F847|nr:uncharacterized protein LOC111896084 [Lactuca sativa]
MARNEGDYMLVDHRHKINYYKTTIVRVSAPFVDRIDPFNFVTFHDLTAINFDTRVAFDFIGKVVSTDPIRQIMDKGSEKSGKKIQLALWDGFALKLNSYISEHQNDNAPVIILLRQPQVGNCLFESRLHINDHMPHISEIKKVTADMDFNVESSINTSQLNTDIVVAKAEDYYLRFPIKNIDDIPDYNEEKCLSIIATTIGFDLDERWVRVVIRVKYEIGSHLLYCLTLMFKMLLTAVIGG